MKPTERRAVRIPGSFGCARGSAPGLFVARSLFGLRGRVLEAQGHRTTSADAKRRPECGQ